jgi:hypothetical protein
MRIEGKGQHVYLHRFLLSLPPEPIAFGNGNTLDCRRDNLTTTTAAASQTRGAIGANNTSGYKGVSFNKAAKKFKSYIKKDGKLMHLGLFETATAAALAYNEKAKELFGESAGLNKI